MTLASVLSASAKSAEPVAMARIDNRTSVEGRPRTASRLGDRLPAPPALASPLASSRCALTPGAATPSLHAVAAGGHRRSNSSPSLQHRHSGRRLLVPRRPEWAPHVCVTDLRPNPAVERTRRYGPSPWQRRWRRAPHLVRWADGRATNVVQVVQTEPIIQVGV